MITPETVSEILSSPARERARLLEVIWQSFVDAPETLPLPEWQLKVIDERLAADDADPSQGHDWNDVRRRLEVKA